MSLLLRIFFALGFAHADAQADFKQLILAEVYKAPEYLEIKPSVDRRLKQVGYPSVDALIQFCPLEENDGDFVEIIKLSFMPRDLSELEASLEKKPSSLEITKFYQPRFSGYLRKEFNITHLVYSEALLSADYLQFYWLRDKPRVCIAMSKEPFDFRVEAVIHELVHFALQRSLVFTDPMNSNSFNEYGAKVLLKPGGEVDAYSAGYHFLHRKKLTRGETKMLANYFTADGKPIPGKENYIAQTLLKISFYRTQVIREFQNAFAAETEHLTSLTKMAEFRERQSELTDDVNEKATAMNSAERLKKEINRQKEIMARFKALSASIPSLQGGQ